MFDLTMSHAEQLLEIATELAMDAKDEAAALQRHLAGLETRKLEMEPRLSTAKFALQRLSSFVSVRGTELQCPRCWILNSGRCARSSTAFLRNSGGLPVAAAAEGPAALGDNLPLVCRLARSLMM